MSDPIDALVNWQIHRRPIDTETVARCLTHGTEWNADAADFCPDCADLKDADEADAQWYRKTNGLEGFADD